MTQSATLLPYFFRCPLICALILVGSYNGHTQNKKLFELDDAMMVTLSGDLRSLLSDHTHSSRVAQWKLAFDDENGAQQIPIEVKQRGHFRRFLGNCSYPPLQIKFPKDGPQSNTIFKDQHKMKLVMPCRGDEYIIREWLVYKVYNLISPYSFRVKLLKINLQDDTQKKQPEPFYAFLLEEEEQLAQRHQMNLLERKLRPGGTQVEHFLRMAVFQYMIANTDWSVEYLQNIKLLTPDAKTIPITVPYDFDHAGIVEAPYAKPTAELELNSLRQRRYRGYCTDDLATFEPIITQFNALKDSIYRVYTDCSLVNPKYIKTTLAFLDDFYATINNPQKWQREFTYPCDPKGTGGVVIQGLKEQ